MNYTAEQRAIIARLGDSSRQCNEMAARHRAEQIQSGRNMIDAVTALTQAIDRSNELAVLHQRHGDLWREFLDTL